jgi:hypothetical protein
MRKRRASAKGRPQKWLDAAQQSTLTAIGRALKERFPPSKTLSPAIVSLVSRMNEEPRAHHGTGSEKQSHRDVKPTWRVYEYTWHARACEMSQSANRVVSHRKRESRGKKW